MKFQEWQHGKSVYNTWTLKRELVKMVQLKFGVMEKPQDGMMEKLKDSMIILVLKINGWSQTQTPRMSDDDYDDRQN